jgi:atlastin
MLEVSDGPGVGAVLTGQPLQIVKLDMAGRKAVVDADALGRLEQNLREIGPMRVSVVSVMGAFRTGKSFLLDLFLRFLRHEERCGPARGSGGPHPREEGAGFALPAWMTSAGGLLEGAGGSVGGFKSKGGMDGVTEGVWVWSEPFVRVVQEGLATKKVAVILMDTQGAWDGSMTKEQSATVFGLTAVLSSKLIYNVNMQVQEDKIENLAFFASFARSALSKSVVTEREETGRTLSKEDLDRPFQSLDFLVRDWRYFRPEWSFDQCRQQMQQHIRNFIDPARAVENSTAEVLNGMFQNIDCFCLPHPGFTIEREAWSGDITAIDQGFIRFADAYVRQVFSNAMDVKVILGRELSTLTFPLVLQKFVNAFQDMAPQSMSFIQAMACSTELIAKDHAMTTYTKLVRDELSKSQHGLTDEAFEAVNSAAKETVKADFNQILIFGGDGVRRDIWKSIEDNLDVLQRTFRDENERLLGQGLVAFARVALLGSCFFLVDRASDIACDWWLQICVDLSKLMCLAYCSIFAYICLQIYRLGSESGKLSVASAIVEMCKEMVRLLIVYGDAAKGLKITDLLELTRIALASLKARPSHEKKSN